MWDIVLTYVVPSLLSAAISFCVCMLNNKHVLKMKMLDILEKQQHEASRLDEQRDQQTRDVLSEYLSATGKYISSPSLATETPWCEVKETVFIYAPRSTHDQIRELNDYLLNYSTRDWTLFLSRQNTANDMLAKISQAFADFLNQTLVKK